MSKHAHRRDVIEAIVTAAIEGMTPVVESNQATNDEVMSAYFTLLRRGIQACLTITLHQKQTRAALRGTLFSILAECADTELH